jgi:PKD repeat protein
MCLTAVIVVQQVSAADELEIFAGQDKNSIVNRQLRFNDAEIIKPDPPDPVREYTFSWDFDDRLDLDLDGIRNNDGESLDRYTTWAYDTPGIYIVTLTVSDGTNVVLDTLQVTVREDEPPYLQVEPYQVAPYGIPYQLEVTAHDDAVEDLAWEWDLGDGGLSTEPAPLTHTYGQLGELEVIIKVVDLAGNEASARFTVDVVDVSKPRCDAGPDVTINVNETVDFDGSGSSDNVGVTDWTWTFPYGDGVVTLSGPMTNHTFRISGTFVVGLRVQDAAGNAATDTLTVNVRSPGGDDGGNEEPYVFEPVWELKVWRSLILVVLVIVAFAVSSTINSLRERRTDSLRDLDVYYRHRAPR